MLGSGLNEPDLLAHTVTGIVAREVVEAYGIDVGRHPVGTGPYMLTSRTPGTFITVP